MKVDRILGKCKDSNLPEAADRSCDIFLGGCNLTTTVESLRQYCSQEIKVDIIDCFEIKIVANKYKCFKISITIPNRDRILDPELWTENVWVRKFYKNRSNGRAA